MICGMDPKVDFAFKKLFGDPRNSQLSKSLINATFEDFGLTPIVDLQFRNPFNLQETETDKLSILDIKANDETGRQLNLEMQVRFERDLCPRIVFYLADLHSTQLSERDDFGKLCPSISILFVNQILFPKTKQVHTRFQLCDQKSRIVFSDQIEVHVIELPKLLKKKKLTSGLEQWGYFLLRAKEIDLSTIPEQLTLPEIKKALSELVRMRGTPEERLKYMERERMLRECLTWENEKIRWEEDKTRLNEDKIQLEEDKIQLEEDKIQLEALKAEIAQQEAEIARRNAEVAEQCEVIAKQSQEAAKQSEEAAKQNEEVAKRAAEIAQREMQFEQSRKSAEQKSDLIDLIHQRQITSGLKMTPTGELQKLTQMELEQLADQLK